MVTQHPDGEYWNSIDIHVAPQLILAKRRGKEIEAVLVNLHEDVLDDLRRVCRKPLTSLSSTTPRFYEPHASLDFDVEHFLIGIDEIPERPEPTRSRRRQSVADDDPDLTAGVIKALRDPGALTQVGAREVKGFKTLFYSIAFQQPDHTWVHFIRKDNPSKHLKPGVIWSQYGDCLKKVEAPAFGFDDKIDVVLTSEYLASFSGVKIQQLFNDVHIVMQEVPNYVDKIATSLGAGMVLAEDAKQVLKDAGTAKVTVANRLYQLQDRLASTDVTADQFVQCLSKCGLNESDFIDFNGCITLTVDNVGSFLDVMEGRLFQDDWTGDQRRADRFSTRPANLPGNDR